MESKYFGNLIFPQSLVLSFIEKEVFNEFQIFHYKIGNDFRLSVKESNGNLELFICNKAENQIEYQGHQLLDEPEKIKELFPKNPTNLSIQKQLFPPIEKTPIILKNDYKPIEEKSFHELEKDLLNEKIINETNFQWYIYKNLLEYQFESFFKNVYIVNEKLSYEYDEEVAIWRKSISDEHVQIYTNIHNYFNKQKKDLNLKKDEYVKKSDIGNITECSKQYDLYKLLHEKITKDKLLIKKCVKAMMSKYTHLAEERHFEKIFIDNTPGYLPIKPKKVINITTGEVSERKKEHYFQLEIDYSEDDWKSYKDNIPHDSLFLQTIYQIVSYNVDYFQILQMVTGAQLYGKPLLNFCLYQYGIGRNGKSTLYKLLKLALPDFVDSSNMTLFNKETGAPNGARDNIKNYRLIYVEEVVNSDEKKKNKNEFDHGMFKRLVTGEDVTGRKLHRDDSKFAPNIHLVCISNLLMKLPENDKAFYDRLRFLRLNSVFINSENKQIDKINHIYPLNEKLEKEFMENGKINCKYLITWIIQGSIYYHSNFEGRENLLRILAKYDNEIKQEILCSGLIPFINSNFCKSEDITSMISMNEFYNAYEDYCKDKRIFAMNKEQISDYLLKIKHEFIRVSTNNYGKVDGLLAIKWNTLL